MGMVGRGRVLPLLLALLFGIAAGTLLIHWLLGGHLLRPVFTLIALSGMALALTDPALTMAGWMVVSPLVNWFQRNNIPPEARNAVSWREVIDFDRMVILFLFLYLFITRRGKEDAPPSLRPISLMMACYALYLAGNSLGLSLNTFHALRAGIDAILVPFLAFFISRKVFTDRRGFSLLLGALVVLAVYMVGLGATELAVTGDLFRRIRWPFPFWESYGFFFALILPVMLFLFLDRAARRERATLANPVGVLLVLMVTGVFFTLTRNAWLAFLVGAFFFHFRTRSLVFNPFQRFLAVLLFASLPLFLISSGTLSDSEFYQNRLANADTIENRLETYRFGLEQAAAHPLVGIGFRNFREMFGEVARAGDFEAERSNPGRSTIHSAYLNILAEQGMIGLLLFLGVVGASWWGVKRFAEAVPSLGGRMWSAVGMTMIVVYLVSAIAYDHIFDAPYFISKTFFVVMGTFFSAGAFLEGFRFPGAGRPS